MATVIKFTKKKSDLLKELEEGLIEADKYFAVVGSKEYLVCYHSPMELGELLILKEVLNTYINECFTEAMEYPDE